MSGSGAPESRRARFAGSNLQLRIVSALVLGVVVLALAWLGGMPFRVLAALMAAAVFYEWSAMAGADGRPYRHIVRALLVLVLALLIAGLPAVFCFGALGLAIVIVVILEALGGHGFWSAAGLAYAGLPAIAAAFLRGDDKAGLQAILFVFVVVWATDILAYVVGRSVGGPKLAPSISPGKTQSGALGGTIGGVVAGVLFCLAVGGTLPLLFMGVAAFLLSVLSQAGDLGESAMKRHFGVKDSGRMIPGHGGVMDRVDGLVIAAFVFYLMGMVIAGPDVPAHGFFGP